MQTADKGLNGFIVSVLGTNYTVRCVNNEQFPVSYKNDCKGLCDYSSREIWVTDMEQHRKEYESLTNLESITNQTVRHELIHAFLVESGLGDEADIDEVIIDWFALQMPKLVTAFCKAKAFSKQEIDGFNKAWQDTNLKGAIKNNVD